MPGRQACTRRSQFILHSTRNSQKRAAPLPPAPGPPGRADGVERVALGCALALPPSPRAGGPARPAGLLGFVLVLLRLARGGAEAEEEGRSGTTGEGRRGGWLGCVGGCVWQESADGWRGAGGRPTGGPPGAGRPRQAGLAQSKAQGQCIHDPAISKAWQSNRTSGQSSIPEGQSSNGTPTVWQGKGKAQNSGPVCTGRKTGTGAPTGKSRKKIQVENARVSAGTGTRAPRGDTQFLEFGRLAARAEPSAHVRRAERHAGRGAAVSECVSRAFYFIIGGPPPPGNGNSGRQIGCVWALRRAVAGRKQRVSRQPAGQEQQTGLSKGGEGEQALDP